MKINILIFANNMYNEKQYNNLKEKECQIQY